MSRQTQVPTATRATKDEVRAALNLDSAPTDEFMALLAELGDGDVAAGPVVPPSSRDYRPDEIVEVVINGTVGDLLARARGERTFASVGKQAGVTRARIHELEHSDNVQIATFVRVAEACGYRVSVTLQPMDEGRPQLSATLSATA